MTDTGEREWGDLLAKLGSGETPAESLRRLLGQRQIYADRLQSIDDLVAELIQAHPGALGRSVEPAPATMMPPTRSKGAFDGLPPA